MRAIALPLLAMAVIAIHAQARGILMEKQSAAESNEIRWSLPKDAKYKNVKPLIGIMTQPCHDCPGLAHQKALEHAIPTSHAIPLSLHRTILHCCWIRQVD